MRAHRSSGAVGASLPTSWQVHLPIFDGPLDLLLHLVKLNEVEITDIPVATVCEQFHDYLMLMEELNLDVAGEYIYEAAQLIHLKSRLLLPRPTGGDEEGDDPRQELVERLLEYQRLKQAAQSLAEVDRVRGGIWTRRIHGPGDLAPPAEEIELGELSLFDLLTALSRALDRYQHDHPATLHVGREVYSVREQFDRLLTALGGGRPFPLVDDLRKRSCRAEAVAAFLAVLELARLALVRLHPTAEGEILLYRTTRELAREEHEGIRG